METTQETTSSDTFAEDGDLIAVIGAGDTKRIFQIDSGVLRAASTVWRAMLRSFSADQKWELSDADPEAFAIAMKVAYYRAAEIPAEMPDATLVEIARLCERYELHRLLANQLVQWTTTLRERSIETRLSVAWSLYRKDDFENAWSDLVKHAEIHDDGMMFLRSTERVVRKSFARCGSKAKSTKALPKKRSRQPVRKCNVAYSSDEEDPKELKLGLPAIEKLMKVVVDKTKLSEEILKSVTTARTAAFEELSRIYQTILESLLADTAPDESTIYIHGYEEDDPMDCDHHKEVLLHRIFAIARRGGLLNAAFPLSFTRTLSFDTQHDTVESSANLIRVSIFYAGRDVACDCVQEVLEMVDAVVDGAKLPREIASRFGGPAAEDAGSKRQRVV